MDLPPHALQVSPESTLQFTLTRDIGTVVETSTGCTMTLHHLGKTSEHLAFKVKTTQPRRYLVRPNQGVVAPNSSETVSILLVEKDKLTLLDSFERLGQSALDHSKDKFLVQSCAVQNDFASKYMAEKAKIEKQSDGNAKTGKELAETLTGLWNSITSSGTVPIYNKKLHVRHVVPEGTIPSQTRRNSSESALASQLKPVDKPAIENMTPEQIYAEISSLRRKYDELLSFSVNLTAERDILNNTLDQTKRDLNRARAAIKEGSSGGNDGKKSDLSGVLSFSIFQVLLVALLCILGGIKIGNMESADFLLSLPVLSTILGDGSEGL